MNTNIKSPFIAFMAVTALLGFSGAVNHASADSLSNTSFEINSVANTQNVGISNDGHGIENVYTGRYGAVLNGKSVYVYCVDPSHVIYIDQTYNHSDAADLATSAPSVTMNVNGYYDGGLGSEITNSNVDPGATITAGEPAQRGSEVAWLTDTFLNASQSTFDSYSDTSGYSYSQDQAAVQLSIWDIIQDGGDGLTSGNFQTSTSAASTYGSIVAGLEDSAFSHSGYTSDSAYWIQSSPQNGNHAQNQITVMPTPEPSAASIFGIGFGVLLLAAGLQRKRAISRY